MDEECGALMQQIEKLREERSELNAQLDQLTVRRDQLFRLSSLNKTTFLASEHESPPTAHIYYNSCFSGTENEKKTNNELKRQYDILKKQHIEIQNQIITETRYMKNDLRRQLQCTYLNQKNGRSEFLDNTKELIDYIDKKCENIELCTKAKELYERNLILVENVYNIYQTRMNLNRDYRILLGNIQQAKYNLHLKNIEKFHKQRRTSEVMIEPLLLHFG